MGLTGADEPAPGVDGLPALGPDAIVVHIGVHKTGTTALQADLRRLRKRLASLGVTYPATGVSQHRGGRALVAGELAWEATRTNAERASDWQAFAREVSGVRGRVLLSSEPLCQATDDQAKRLVEDLGRERVHILVAFRPLMTLLPSSWQQSLKAGKDLSYDDWLRAVLATRPVGQAADTFWRRNDVAAQVGRWRALLGAAGVTAVVVDSPADTKLRRSIECLHDLPAGTIGSPVDRTTSRSNRSMTVAEAELVRRVNILARERMSVDEYLRLVRFGAVRHMVDQRRPEPDEAQLGLPDWAVRRVGEIGARQSQELQGSGVGLVGSPAALAECSAFGGGPDQALPVDAAAQALLGVVLAAARGGPPGRESKSRVHRFRVRARARAKALARRLGLAG